MDQTGGSLDFHSMLKKLNITNTPLNELHYYDVFKGKFDAYAGPLTNLQARCLPSCSKDNLQPKTFNSTDYIYDNVTKLAHVHDHEYEAIENDGDSTNDLQLKLEADRKLVEALSNLDLSFFSSENLKRHIIKLLMSLKISLGMGLSQSDVNKETANILAKEIHTPAKLNYPRRKVLFFYLDQIHRLDLAEMPKVNGYHYILVVIDFWSKYVWTVALKNKTGETVVNVIKALPIKPKEFYTSDDGKEFINKQVQNYLESINIKWYSVKSEIKCSIVERVIRTLKTMMETRLTAIKSQNLKSTWLDILPDIVNDYNNKIHKTISMSPAEARLDKNQDKLKQLYKEIRRVRVRNGSLLKVGDFVRIYSYKYKFDKSYKGNWTHEIFKIKEVDTKSNPITYVLEDENKETIIGKFYRQELLPTKFSF